MYELSEAIKAPLGHMFKSHANCSAEWCFKTRASEGVKTYNKTDNEFRCKKIQSAVQSPEEDCFHISNRQSSKKITAYL